MKVKELEKFVGKKVKITTQWGTNLVGMLKRTGEYTFSVTDDDEQQFSEQLILAGSISFIKELSEKEYEAEKLKEKKRRNE